jgi:ABC-2 type transport system permease protein
MNWHRVSTIMRKEWEETIRNRTIVLTFLSMLFIFTAMPLALAFGGPAIAGDAFVRDPDMAGMTDLLLETFPQFAQLGIVEQFQVYMLRQFLVLFLLLPVMGAMSIATYSIIGEKTSRSLEALLATPIRTDELLLAKSLAAALPTVLATWVAFALFAGLVRLLGGPLVTAYALDAAAWAMILLMTPLVALLGLGMAVLVSARANDPRSAQQVGAVVVLPLVALVVAQAAGLLLVGLPLIIAASVVLVVLDIAVLSLGVRIFNRETILTRWR